MFDVSCVIDNNYYRLSLLYIHVLYIDGYYFVFLGVIITCFVFVLF